MTLAPDHIAEAATMPEGLETPPNVRCGDISDQDLTPGVLPEWFRADVARHATRVLTELDPQAEGWTPVRKVSVVAAIAYRKTTAYEFERDGETRVLTMTQEKATCPNLWEGSDYAKA